MTRIRIAMMFAVTLMMSACDDGSKRSPAPTDPAAAQADRALIARMEALPPGQLDMVLFRAIRDARQPCQGITASRRIADQDRRPAWSAQCDGSDGKYLLVLNPDGVTAVTPGRAFGQP